MSGAEVESAGSGLAEGVPGRLLEVPGDDPARDDAGAEGPRGPEGLPVLRRQVPGRPRPKVRRLDERPLRQRPRAFKAIFGDVVLTPETTRKLLSALAVLEVRAYVVRPEEVRGKKARDKVARRREEAARYIFDRTPLCEPALSFEVVCKIIGVDPDYARRAVLRRTPEEVRGIVKRLTEYRRRRAAE